MKARPSGRASDQLRPVRITRKFTRHAEGSVLVEFGDTRVLCTASVEETVPAFLRNSGSGWVTAEYGMLPRATHTRARREAALGYAWRCGTGPKGQRAPLGLALQWWLGQLESPATRKALLERHAGPPA